MQNLEALIEVFAKRNMRLSVAESCTGGLIASTITKKSGVSKIFEGGVVSYSNTMKVQVLQVSKALIRTHGAVSRPVALQMAKGIRNITNSDWSISTTGVAGPTGGSSEKPVGLVCFGLVGPGVELSFQEKFNGDRESIQAAAANFALQTLWKHLENHIQN